MARLTGYRDRLLLDVLVLHLEPHFHAAHVPANGPEDCPGVAPGVAHPGHSFPGKGAGKAPGRASTPILEAAEGIPAEV